jgi:hypothetical protein
MLMNPSLYALFLRKHDPLLSGCIVAYLDAWKRGQFPGMTPAYVESVIRALYAQENMDDDDGF